MVAAQTGENEFVISGSDVRVRFALDKPAAGESGSVLRVEEGSFAPDGEWVTTRIWNGDQTDYGINFTGTPVMLRVTLAALRN
jgi:hypothetical protein